jgi:hypothetical protein
VCIRVVTDDRSSIYNTHTHTRTHTHIHTHTYVAHKLGEGENAKIIGQDPNIDRLSRTTSRIDTDSDTVTLRLNERLGSTYHDVCQRPAQDKTRTNRDTGGPSFTAAAPSLAVPPPAQKSGSS